MRFVVQQHPSTVNRQRRSRRRFGLTPMVLSVAVAGLLGACGGGGDGTSADVVPPVVVKTTISGTAATGEAMAGASVRVKCVAGTGTATAAASGVYTVELADATLPCVASATSSDGTTVLHSLVSPAGGNTQTININPLTELVVAQLAATAAATLPAPSPTDFYASFGAGTAASVTATSITSAITTVVATLRAGGVDFSAVGNPITAPLVAASAGITGNAYDQALDALGAKLRAAGTTLAQLATQVAAAAAPAGSPSTATGLPPAMLLQPAAPTCAALRSGTYRIVNPNETDPDWATSLMELNATTGLATFRDGSTETAVSTGNCTFSANDGNTRMVVSQGGVIVWTSFAANLGKQVLAIAFPEQPAALADMAGTWNILEFSNFQDQTPTPLWINDFTLAEFAADGRHISLAECFGLQPCIPLAGPLGSIRVSAQGGLDYVNADGSVVRVFIYRPGSGDPMMVLVQPNSFLAVASPRRTVAARTLGETWSTSSLAMVSNGAAASSFSSADYRVSDADATTQTYTRQAVADGNSQPFTANKPRDGLVYRAAGTSTLTNGQVVSFNELVVMPLPGLGLSVYGTIATDSTRNLGSYGFVVTGP